MEKIEEFAYMIHRQMKRKKIENLEMGNLLGLSKDTFCAKMNLRRKFYLEEIIKICDYLGLEITIKRKDENHDKT